MTRFARARTVADPSGTIWTVARIVPARPLRLRSFRNLWDRRKASDGSGEGGAWLEFLDVPFDEGVTGVVLVIAFVALVALVVFVVFPLLAFLFDLLIVMAIVGTGIALRLLHRRPWRIEARATDGMTSYAWGVYGTRASAATVAVVARDIGRGIPIGEMRPGIPLEPGSG